MKDVDKFGNAHFNKQQAYTNWISARDKAITENKPHISVSR